MVDLGLERSYWGLDLMPERPVKPDFSSERPNIRDVQTDGQMDARTKVPLFPVFHYRVAAQKADMLACAYFRPGNTASACHNNVCVLVDILPDLNMAK